MTWLIIALLSGAAALAVALLYVANEKARITEYNEMWQRHGITLRVRAAWNKLAHELGRPPTTAELIDELHPPEPGVAALAPDQSFGLEKGGKPPLYSPNNGGEAQEYGLPPSSSPDDEQEEFDIWMNNLRGV